MEIGAVPTAIACMIVLLLSVYFVKFPLQEFFQRNQQTFQRREKACTYCSFFLAFVPGYLVLTWFLVSVEISSQGGADLIDNFCSFDDLRCVNWFTFGTNRRDIDACRNKTCSDLAKQLRAGSRTEGFPFILGYHPRAVEMRTEPMVCTEANDDGDCLVFFEIENLGGNPRRTCFCDEDSSSFKFCATVNCTAWSDDVVETRSQSCVYNLGAKCLEWDVQGDSNREFVFGRCECVDLNCDSWICSVDVIPYFYPNLLVSSLILLFLVVPLVCYFGYLVLTVLDRIDCSCCSYTDPGSSAWKLGLNISSASSNETSQFFDQRKSSKQLRSSKSTRLPPLSNQDVLGLAVTTFLAFLLAASIHGIWKMSGNMGMLALGCVLVFLLLCESRRQILISRELARQRAEIVGGPQHVALW